MRFFPIMLPLLSLLLVLGASGGWPQQAGQPASAFSQSGVKAGEGVNSDRRPATAFRRDTSAQGAPRASGPGFWIRFQRWIINKQRFLHGELTKGVRQLKTGNPLVAIWSLAVVSFIYGVVHAVGPGHGKAVITSYVFANEKTLKRGIWLAVLASLMQAVTAVTVVSVLAILLNATGLRIQAFTQHMEVASYALVALIGAWLVFNQLRKIFQLRKPAIAALAEPAVHDHAHHAHADHAHHHHHEHDHHEHSETCGCGHAHIPAAESLGDDDWSWKKAVSIILAVGMRPCTGAIIVLVFAFVNGLYWAGVASTFAMAVGTAITISSLAVLAVGSKQLALKLYGGHSHGAMLFINGVALIGGLFVLFLGVTLFTGALGPARPFG